MMTDSHVARCCGRPMWRNKKYEIDAYVNVCDLEIQSDTCRLQIQSDTVRYIQTCTAFKKCLCACIHDKKTYTYALPLSNAYVYVSACMLACMYTAYMHICTWYSSCEPRYMQIQSNRCRYRYMHITMIITYTLCICDMHSAVSCAYVCAYVCCMCFTYMHIYQSICVLYVLHIHAHMHWPGVLDVKDFTTWTPGTWELLPWEEIHLPKDPNVSICSVRSYMAIAMIMSVWYQSDLLLNCVSGRSWSMRGTPPFTATYTQTGWKNDRRTGPMLSTRRKRNG
jgi:hypothetical protein